MSTTAERVENDAAPTGAASPRRRHLHRADIPRRWAIYLRISKDDELNGEGVAKQERQCRKLFAERQLSGEIVAVYTDNDTSAWKARVTRPDYERMIDDIRRGTVTGVLAYKSDRIYRKPRDLENLIDLVGVQQPLRVAIECVRSGSIDLSTAAGRTQARVFAVIAAGESETTSERLRDHMTDRASQGLPGGGRRPFGYEADKVTPHPIEAPIMREIVERIASGETLRGVCTDLNERGVRSSLGHTFTPVTLRQLVVNARYIGRRMHNRVDVGPAVWPAIVDESAWRRANALIDQRRGKRRAARRYLLSGGIARCGKCGHDLVGRPLFNHPGQHVYVCPPRADGGCSGVQVRGHLIDPIVVETVIRLVESPAYAAALAARTSSDDAAARAVAAAQRELTELADAKEANALTTAEYLRFKAAAQERLAAASQSMASQTTHAAAGRYLGQQGLLSTAWDDLTLDVRRAIICCVIDYVTVLPAPHSGTKFDPTRVVPHFVA